MLYGVGVLRDNIGVMLSECTEIASFFTMAGGKVSGNLVG
jgi:hypothetical protein